MEAPIELLNFSKDKIYCIPGNIKRELDNDKLMEIVKRRPEAKRYYRIFCIPCDQWICAVNSIQHIACTKHKKNLNKDNPIDESIKTLKLVSANKIKNYEENKDKANACPKCYRVGTVDKFFNKELNMCTACERICRGEIKICKRCKKAKKLELFERPQFRRCKDCAQKLKLKLFEQQNIE